MVQTYCILGDTSHTYNDYVLTGKPALLDPFFKCLQRQIFVPRLPLKLNTEHPGGAGPILKPQLFEKSL